MSRRNLNPQSVAQKWSQNLGSAGQAYTAGTSAVSVSPGQSAIEKKDKYLQGVIDSFNNGTYEKGLNSFTLQSWQNSCAQKGSQRLASGAQSAKSKMQQYYSNYFPQLNTILSQIDSMPNSTYEERKARQNAYSDAMHALKGSLKVK